MTLELDEAIKRFIDNAEYERTHGSLEWCLEFKQLADWLKELKDFRDNGAKPWFTAKWVRDRGKSRKCSRCEFSINEDDAFIFHFCPNCGAQMEVEE